MVKNLTKILMLVLLLSFSACQKSGSTSSGSSGTSLFGDDTAQAVGLVNDANNDLKEVKKIYKDNQGKVADLQTAMTSKDAAKVKSITADLASQIKDGMNLGNSAVDKIKKAESLNINADFRQYLSMKEESLQKLLDAFDARGEAAGLLRDNFGTNDPAKINKIKVDFKAKVSDSNDLMDAGQQLSEDANDFAKNAIKKTQ